MPDRRRVVERLDEAECMDLLGGATIGRLVYTSQYGEVALPFEIKIYEESIVVRTYHSTFTAEDLRTDIPGGEYEVAIEVDQIDPESREGWLVLAWGPAHQVDSEAERASLAGVGLESWIDAEPEHYIRVKPVRVAGQRIRQA